MWVQKKVFDLKVRLALWVTGRRVLYCLHRLKNPREEEKIETLMGDRDSPGIVLGFHSPHLIEHIRGVFRRLQGREGIRPLPVIPVGLRGLRRSALRWAEERLGLKYGETLFSYPWVDLLRPRVIVEVAVSPLRGLCPPAIKVLSSHGLACMGFGKNPGFLRYLEDYDYLFLTGPLQRETILSAHKRYGYSLPELVEVGYWMGDRLLERQKDWDRRSYLDSLELEEGPTVFYAPTWGIFSSVGDWLEDVVDACMDLGFNLLLRLHPLMFTGNLPFERGTRDWGSLLGEMCNRYDRVRVVADDKAEGALLSADVLVTDVSSMGMDFALMGKPVVFLPAPHFFRMFGEDFPISRVRRGKEVRSRAQLAKGLLEAVKRPDSFRVPLDGLVYNPGRALDVAVAFLEDIAKGG